MVLRCLVLEGNVFHATIEALHCCLWYKLCRRRNGCAVVMKIAYVVQGTCTLTWQVRHLVFFARQGRKPGRFKYCTMMLFVVWYIVLLAVSRHLVA
jgi:hypothetical protein